MKTCSKTSAVQPPSSADTIDFAVRRAICKRRNAAGSVLPMIDDGAMTPALFAAATQDESNDIYLPRFFPVFFRATLKAIATAWDCFFPAFISVLMF